MKQVLFALLYSARVFSLVSWLNRKRVPILCYHSVVRSHESQRSDPHKQHLPLRLFRRHLAYLQAKHVVLSLADFVEALSQHRTLPDNAVVLMFDDGFEDFFSVVAPELSRRSLPASAFVITDRSDPEYLADDGLSYLKWSEIRQLSAAGIEIGSHTCSHACLTSVPREQTEKELADSLNLILRNTSQKTVPFSFPYGQSSEAINELVRLAGYSCGIIGELGPNGVNTNVFRLKRTVIASDDDLPAFAARVSGATWWVHWLRQRLLTKSNHRLAVSSPSSRVAAKESFDYPGS
jgi:peptidoglycan/xylan/chitin deacetylase (PgdA/CDA1 family)